jgi:lysophospholipase L1-like esterase
MSASLLRGFPVGVIPRGGVVLRYPGGFQPTQLSGLKLWLDAGAITGLNDGDAISTWIDSSGLGNNAAQSTPARKPTYKVNQKNGKPAVKFTGASNNALGTPAIDFSTTQALTIFIVMSSNGIPSANDQYILTLGSDYFGAQDELAILRKKTTGKMYSVHSGAATDAFQSSRDPSGYISFCAVNDKSIVQTGAPFYQIHEAWNYIDGLSSNGSTGGNGGENTNTFGNKPIYVGAFHGGTGPVWGFDGYVAEVIIYARNLTDSERNQVDVYLKNKYALTHANGQIVYIGDSMTTGENTPTAYPYQLMALLGGDWNWGNYGMSGQTLDNMINRNTTWITPWSNFNPAKNIAVLWGGTNDILFGASAATTYTRLTTYANTLRAAGFTVVVLTMLPRSDATFPVGGEAIRQTYNTSIRNGYASFADALVDVASDSRIGDIGDELDLTYYTSDKVHLNDTGCGVVAALVLPVVSAL